MEEALAYSQIPSLLIAAMRRPVRRSRAWRRLEIRGECGIGYGATNRGEGSRQKRYNNYLAQSAETGSRAKGPGKVGVPGGLSAVASAEAQRRRGAPFGNRNAAKPELAELRAHKAKVAALVARAKAAIAAANAIIAAQPKRRRITCITYVENGVVRRVCARVRVQRRAEPAEQMPPSVSRRVSPPPLLHRRAAWGAERRARRMRTMRPRAAVPRSGAASFCVFRVRKLSGGAIAAFFDTR